MRANILPSCILRRSTAFFRNLTLTNKGTRKHSTKFNKYMVLIVKDQLTPHYSLEIDKFKGIININNMVQPVITKEVALMSEVTILSLVMTVQT